MTELLSAYGSNSAGYENNPIAENECIIIQEFGIFPISPKVPSHVYFPFPLCRLQTFPSILSRELGEIALLKGQQVNSLINANQFLLTKGIINGSVFEKGHIYRNNIFLPIGIFKKY